MCSTAPRASSGSEPARGQCSPDAITSHKNVFGRLAALVDIARAGEPRTFSGTDRRTLANGQLGADPITTLARLSRTSLVAVCTRHAKAMEALRALHIFLLPTKPLGRTR